MSMFKRKYLDVNQMPDSNPETLRRLSDVDLYNWTAGWTKDSAARLSGEVEIRRRESWPARMAIGISIVAVIISVASLLMQAAS